MLVKRSSKNQIAIPKAVLERAGLGPKDTYFDIGYERGAIMLRPVEIEEKIPRESLERFKAKVLKGQPGDRTFSSAGALIKYLKSKR